MAGVFIDVWHNDGSPFGGSGPAYSATEGDVETAQGSLIGSDAQQHPGLYDPIKASPQVSERMID